GRDGLLAGPQHASKNKPAPSHGMERAFLFGQPVFWRLAERAGGSRDALDHGGARPADFALLERNDRQSGEGVEQFARAQQEIRVARPTEPLVPGGEGL